MTKRIVLTASIAATVLGGCATLGNPTLDRVGGATLRNADGAPVGRAELIAHGDGISLAMTVTGLSEGVHGLHLHTVGACRVPDFTSAGGHLNPYSKRHGSESGTGPHLGDLPNLTIGASRTASIDIELRGTRDELLDQIFDSDGTALVIHEEPDDYRTDPSGNSGKRIACGEIDRASH